MRIIPKICLAAALTCMAQTCWSDPVAPAPTPNTANTVLPADDQKQAAFDAVQHLRSATTMPEIADALTNKSAAQMAIIEALGLSLVAGFQAMGTKNPDPNFSKDLVTYLNGFGLNDKTMPKGSLDNLPVSATSRGRDLLKGLVPFDTRVQKLSSQSSPTPPVTDYPADPTGYKMTVIDPTTVKITVLSPKAGSQLPSTFYARSEDGVWRVDLGDPTKGAGISSSSSTPDGSSYKETPGAAAKKLFDAVQNDDLHTVKVILTAHPALMEARDDQGATPLISVAFWDHLDVAQFLVSRHASINAKDNTGTTALMNASSFDHIEIAKFLIARGAGINQKDDFDKTALDQAKQMNHPEIINLLQSHGAK